MTAAQLHLMFTHLPVIGLLFTMIVNIYGMVRKNPEIGKLMLIMYVITGIFGLIAYLTGDPAEELLEGKLGYAESVIEPHETWALIFFIGLMFMTILAGIRLYLLNKSPFNQKTFAFFLIIAALLAVLATGTALTGGSIRHTESETVVLDARS
jgi:uncharacterized membrane protein